MLNFTWSLGSGRRDGFEIVLFTPEGNITGRSSDTPSQYSHMLYMVLDYLYITVRVT